VNGDSSFKAWLMAAAAVAAALLVCLAWVDRPVADLVQAHLRGTAFFDWTTRALDLLPSLLLPVLLGLAAAGVLALRGRPMPAWTRLPMLCAWSVAWGLSAGVVLKRVFGRSQTDLYFPRGVYEFRLLHGSYGYEAFPSGTTTVACALLAVLWIRRPRLRGACALLIGVVSVALVLTNSHWVSDVIAGCLLGAAIGAMTVRLLGRESRPREGSR
jgi:membrane-associated phospholipid phosphatase